MNAPVPGRFVVPEIVATNFHLRDGDQVADLGAGSGFFLKALSTAVGETGRVYACEIQKQLVEKLGEQARIQGLGNVHPLWCDLEEENGIPLQRQSLDALVMVNTLFLIQDKETMVGEAYRILRTGGTFHLVDWTESFGGLGPQPQQVYGKGDAIALFESKQFIYEREYPAGDHHYGVSFRKP
jgi:ubiquinone/menaquinone biosynthesis C-methylase UbiE